MLKVKIHNIQAISNLENKIRLKKVEFMSDIVQAAVFLRMAIEQGLQNLLGDGARHFKVFNYGNQYGNTVIVKPIDDIGYYIYRGTSPHLIFSRDGGPLASVAREFGPVAGPVPHPGTPARKTEIDAEVAQAVAKVMVLFD
jgi:hypothetical protein